MVKLESLVLVAVAGALLVISLTGVCQSASADDRQTGNTI